MLSAEEKVDRVQHSVDYIEAHMFEPLDNKSLARASGLSLYHFQETFREITGCAPSAYVHRRRLTLAAEDLLGTGRDLAVVAWDYGYESLPTFSRAFRRQYGVSPGRYRREGTDFWFNGLQPFRPEQLLFRQTKLDLEPEVVELERTVLRGAMRESSYGDQLNRDRFVATREQMESCDDERSIELVSVADPGSMLRRSNVNGFLVRAEELRGGTPHPEYRDVELPGGRYAKFRHRGTRAELAWTNAFIWNEAESKIDGKLDYLAPMRIRAARPDAALLDDELDVEIYVPLRA